MCAKSIELTGMRFGDLVVIGKAEGLQDRYYTWHCRCDCGNEIEMTESDFVFGGSVSCGCVRQQRWDDFLPAQWLTFVDGTCVEWLANRKSRADNTSGFRGVYKLGDAQFRAGIGLQGKRYHLGTYKTFDEAVAVRLAVEEFLHDGFIACFEEWKKKAEMDEQWAARNPFFFDVEKDQRTFQIKSAVTELKEFQY